MTTRITVHAHAGWPVEVTAIDRFQMNPLNPGDATVRISALGVVPGGSQADYHVTDSREIVIRELRRPDATTKAPPRPLDFGDVVRGLKAGKRFTRQGWNGKDMWIALSGPTGPRQIAAENFWSPHNAAYARERGGSAPVMPCVTMKTAGGEIVMGWLASQTDVLAEDWQEV